MSEIPLWLLASMHAAGQVRPPDLALARARFANVWCWRVMFWHVVQEYLAYTKQRSHRTLQ